MTNTGIASLDSETKKNVNLWLQGGYDEDTKKAIRKMLQEDPKEVTDAFYTTLSFGTAGMRGIMGVGSNRMNQYTVRAATQGLANYLAKQPKSPRGHSVLIGYDSRHNSRFFAEEAAKVLAANGIHTYLFKDLRPVPLVSFGCRFKKCSAAIMITASHNPKQYNGYKVYWNDGGQVLPPHDIGITAEFDAITDLNMVKKVDSLKNPLIEMVEEDIDSAYLKTIARLQLYPKEDHDKGKNLSIVYSNLHGTGITLMPRALNEWGFSNITLVESQIKPDGDFPTAAPPNPEERQALKAGIETLEKVNGDILISTDPDADRLGVVLKHRGEIFILNGNQIACICLEHICEALTATKKMPKKAGFVKSIVTTELFKAIADAYHKKCVDVLTGFKYIAQQIRSWEQEPEGYQFIFGAEESYGYLFGTQSRDKDAVLSGVLVCEVALHAKLKGKTLVDVLEDIYKKYGVYSEKLLSIKFEESKEGKEKMARSMEFLRKKPPRSINNVEVTTFEDYMQLTALDVKSGKTSHLTFTQSDILIFRLTDGSKVIVRPSGTEPKIKVYCGVVNKKKIPIEEAMAESDQRADAFLKALKDILT